jgi:spore coat protein H
MSKRPVPARIVIRPELDAVGEISFAGRSSLDAYRKSLQLEFGEGRFQERRRSRLSAQLIDPSLLRSALAVDIFQSLNIAVSEVDWVSAYLNRRYLGLYLFIENIDDDFFQRRGLPIRELYKAKFANAAFRAEELSQLSEVFTEESGSGNEVLLRRLYERLWEEHNPLPLSQRIAPLLDVDLFLRYMAAAVFMDHFDGFSNNYYLAHNRSSGQLLTIPWDFDRVWERSDREEPAALVGLNVLLSRLLQEDESRQRFADILEQLLTQFSDEAFDRRMTVFEARIARAHAADPVLQKTPLDQEGQKLRAQIKVWRTKLLPFVQSLRSSSQ